MGETREMLIGTLHAVTRDGVHVGDGRATHFDGDALVITWSGGEVRMPRSQWEPWLKGMRTVRVTLPNDAAKPEDAETPCSWCSGDGFVGVVPCRECKSTGKG